MEKLELFYKYDTKHFSVELNYTGDMDLCIFSYIDGIDLFGIISDFMVNHFKIQGSVLYYHKWDKCVLFHNFDSGVLESKLFRPSPIKSQYTYYIGLDLPDIKISKESEYVLTNKDERYKLGINIDGLTFEEKEDFFDALSYYVNEVVSIDRQVWNVNGLYFK